MISLSRIDTDKPDYALSCGEAAVYRQAYTGNPASLITCEEYGCTYYVRRMSDTSKRMLCLDIFEGVHVLDRVYKDSRVRIYGKSATLLIIRILWRDPEHTAWTDSVAVDSLVCVVNRYRSSEI